jgi:hypothetical protein
MHNGNDPGFQNLPEMDKVQWQFLGVIFNVVSFTMNLKAGSNATNTE